MGDHPSSGSWPTDLSFEEYVAIAEEACKSKGMDNLSPYALDLLESLQDDCGGNRAYFRDLTDANNWSRANAEAGAAPEISLTATVNQLGNLTVRWRPCVEMPSDKLEFDPQYLGWAQMQTQAYASQRPPSELLWFKGVRALRVYPGDKRDPRLMRAAVYALRARYQKLVSDLRESMNLVRAPVFVLNDNGHDVLEWHME